MGVCVSVCKRMTKTTVMTRNEPSNHCMDLIQPSHYCKFATICDDQKRLTKFLALSSMDAATRHRSRVFTLNVISGEAALKCFMLLRQKRTDSLYVLSYRGVSVPSIHRFLPVSLLQGTNEERKIPMDAEISYYFNFGEIDVET